MNDHLDSLGKWREEVGLLPFPLYEGGNGSFVMLDGRSGSFCLDLSEGSLDRDGRSLAWSANVGHYVSIAEERVVVQRWDSSPSSYEKYTLRSVLKDLGKFHEYLANSNPERELSVVKHTMRVFRKLRAVIGQDTDGRNALRAFLLLLACAHDEQSREDIDIPRWNLGQGSLDVALSVRPGDWDALIEEFRAGRQLEKLNAHVDLVLRHAAGDVFQEAHFEVTSYGQGQMRMDGFLPSGIVGERPPTVKGVHFTPPSLARAVVEESISRLDLANLDTIDILDPSCGSGEFLREALRMIRLEGFEGQVRLTGWDISGSACDLARFSLAHETRFAENVEIHIEERDSLQNNGSWETDPDLILMNPPFVAWKDMSPSERELVTEIVPGSSAGRGDMAFAFIWKAASTIKPSGIMGTIIPASMLDSYSGRSLRKHLLEKVNLLILARLGSHQLFARSLVDTGFIIAGGQDRQVDQVLALWSDHRSRSTSAALRSLRRIRDLENGTKIPAVGDGYSIYTLPLSGVENETSWAPREYSAWSLNKRLSSLTRVEDLFVVRQGARTGNKPTFVLDTEDYEGLPARERKLFRPAIVNKAIVGGQLKEVAYIFYPHGKNELASVEDLANAAPTYFEQYLLPAKLQLLSRAGIDKARWWQLTWHRRWQERSLPKLVSTYYGTSGSFAWDQDGQYVVVQGFAWLPIADEPEMDDILGHAYLTILNSSLFSKLISAHSNHVSGGQWTLSKQFMHKVPLPDLGSDAINPDLIGQLSKVGKRIRRGERFDTSSADELVNEIYGLGEDWGP